MSLGVSVRRVDAADKARGTALYVDDLRLSGLLHAVLVTAPVPRGRLEALHLEEARAMPGVHAVLTARDVPGQNQIGCVFPDQPLMVEDEFRFLGDRLAVVVAETRAQALAAAARVEVDYEALPVVCDAEEALADGAPVLHPDGNLVIHQLVRTGDADAALAEAEHRFEATYAAPYQEHAYMEPQGVVAIPGPGDELCLHVSMQCPWYVQAAVARAMGLDLSKVRVVQATTGGGFGGKEDYPNEPAACAAMAARVTGRPVKLVFDRAEDIVRSTKRHRIRIKLAVAATRAGRLQAVHATLFVDAGAYAGLSTVVSERANISAVGPYRVPHARVDTFVVRTNNLLGGAYRGFGHPQVAFAFESMMDELAQELGLAPEEIRRQNAVDRHDPALSGQPLSTSGPIRELLEAAITRSDFARRRAAADAFNRRGGPHRRGVGLGFILYGVGLHAGGQHLEGSGALLHVMQDGSAHLSIGGAEIGQGAYTVTAQIASELLGIPTERFTVALTDTAQVPDSGPTVASRTTLMSGNAVHDAASRLRETLVGVAAELLETTPASVDVTQGAYACRVSGRRATVEEVTRLAWRRKVKLSETGWYAPPPKPWDAKTGQGDAYLVYAAAAHVAEVELDLRSGEAKVARVTAVHDVGRAINPDQVHGQIVGGVSHGIGYAIMEDLQMQGGVPLSPGFTDYLIPTSLDMPEVEVVLMDEHCEAGPFGAKGIGEPSLIPCPAAVANAMSMAAGVRFRELPITPERVLAATSRYMV